MNFLCILLFFHPAISKKKSLKINCKRTEGPICMILFSKIMIIQPSIENNKKSYKFYLKMCEKRPQRQFFLKSR